METAKNKADLIAEITTAFDGVSRENGVTLHQARVIDDYGTPEEEAAARANDTETRWQDVPQTTISSMDAILSFLDPKGFRYYLPAYMVCHLTYLDTALDNGGHEYDVFYALGVTGRPIDDFELERFAPLNSGQSRAVAHFLQFEAERERQAWGEDDPDFSRALDTYWGRFL